MKNTIVKNDMMLKMFLVSIVLLLNINQTNAIINDCGPSYNFAQADRYKIVEMTDDLYCPIASAPAAIWIYDADGMVLDCKGHNISGNNMPALLIENSQDITLINCTLIPYNGNSITYINSSDANILNNANSSNHLHSLPPNETIIVPAESNPVAYVVGYENKTNFSEQNTSPSTNSNVSNNNGDNITNTTSIQNNETINIITHNTAEKITNIDRLDNETVPHPIEKKYNTTINQSVNKNITSDKNIKIENNQTQNNIQINNTQLKKEIEKSSITNNDPHTFIYLTIIGIFILGIYFFITRGNKK